MSGIAFGRARSSPDPRWDTIGELVRDAAERSGDREFLRFPGTSLTFAEVHAASNRLARVLAAHGVQRGDRVAIMLGNVAEAEDLTQEVFVRVFRSLSSYTPGTFEGWLHRITTNLFLDSARRRQRIRFEGLGDEVAQRMPGTELTPAQAWDERHLDGDIQEALRALPPDYRAAVVLCDIEGFSYEEIAVTMGVKLGTVRSRIHRARAQLRAALAHRDRQAGRRGRQEEQDVAGEP